MTWPLETLELLVDVHALREDHELLFEPLCIRLATELCELLEQARPHARAHLGQARDHGIDERE